MNITKFFLTGLLGATTLLSMANIAHAEDGSAGDAIYANGGIGQEEADEMRAKAGNYNLRVYMSEGKHGHSITSTQVTITDKKGDVILDVPSAGPMLFVHVPNGSYTINANYVGTTITKKVVVTNRRGTNAHLSWKTTDTNPDTED